MTLTTEQLNIIETAKNLKANEILKIQAIAGSGKTSTLKEIANALPNAKFLYLAFNKTIVEEIKSKMPKNVEVKTIHSLAYAYAKRTLSFKTINPKLKIFDLEPFFDLNPRELSILLQDFNTFLKSSLLLDSASASTKLIWNFMLKGKLSITHDFYLKYYALSQKNHLDKYHYLLLDEAQDTNAVMLSVFLNNACAKILVGDTFQNIYGFNDTINALEIVRADYTCILSHSFRSTQGVLDYANFFLKTFSDKPSILMKSTNHKDIKEESSLQKAFITRSNAGIIHLLSRIKKQNLDIKDFKLLKEPTSIFKPLYAIFACVEDCIALPNEFRYLKHFTSTESLLKYATESLDIEVSNALNLYQKLELQEVLELEKIAQSCYEIENANNIITNAHCSKGLEWDIVELFNDFPSFLQLAIFRLDEELRWDTRKAKTFNFKEYFFKFNQEINLFYVAITRAKYAIIDRSKNNQAKEFISKYNINIQEHFNRRIQGDFTLAFDKDKFNITHKDKDKQEYAIEAL